MCSMQGPKNFARLDAFPYDIQFRCRDRIRSKNAENRAAGSQHKLRSAVPEACAARRKGTKNVARGGVFLYDEKFGANVDKMHEKCQKQTLCTPTGPEHLTNLGGKQRRKSRGGPSRQRPPI